MVQEQGIRIAVLMGGVSSEHDVSICSGLNVLSVLQAGPHAPTPLYIDRGGTWHFDYLPAAPDLTAPTTERGATVPAPHEQEFPEPAASSSGTLERLRGGEFDLVFIAMHGPGGEDGSMQGLLRVADVPFTGSDVLASALAMSKPLAKRVLAAAGVPLAGDTLLPAGDLGARSAQALQAVGLPCVVKPARGGSSFGTQVVTSGEAMAAALRAAWDEDSAALVESFLDGIEVTCGVLGGGADPSRALPLTEIAPRHDGFFDFRAKYTATACDEITPARVDRQVAARVQELALRAHDVVGCEGMSRSDFIITDGGPVMLEINTIPGLTATSLLPQGAAATGIAFGELIEGIVQSARRKFGI